MNLPNFLIVGAAKAGTTSLYVYLGQHPQIYLPRTWKELRFFAHDGHPPMYQGPGDLESNRRTISGLDAYARYFDAVTNETAIGEVSPVYLYSARAPASIQRHVPQAKLIAVLRHPVDRAYSQFLHHRRDGREPLSDFGRALDAEDARVRDHWEWSWHYRRLGFYHDQLKRYFDCFDRSQIRIYLHEDLAADSVGLCRDLFRFLGVDERFVPDTSVQHNVTGIPRSRLLSRIILGLWRTARPLLSPVRPLLPAGWWQRVAATTWRVHNWNLVKPPLDPALRRRLTADYRGDIRRLERLIERDLSSWLNL